MGKRKQTSDLRCVPTELRLVKYKTLPVINNIIKLQPFFPPIEQLFKIDCLENVQEYGISFSDTFTEFNSEKYHLKSTMLVSPFKWMKGNFGSLDLPMSSINSAKIHKKLQNHHNAGYVGSMISIVLSKCQHFPKVFGVFTGTSKEHIIDISDDYEELCEESWFLQNIGKTFELKLDDEIGETIEYSRKARKNLELGEDIVLKDFETLSLETIEKINSESHPAELKHIFEDEEKEDTKSEYSTSDLFDIESISSSFNGSCDSDEESEDQPFAWATFKNVPVQLTFMEKLEGTFYELLKNSDHEKHLAWLSQIIFALSYAQRNFAFTHNDLHGNNIMFQQTQKEFLYYSSSGRTYKIPTYGYLLKIIDFDRSIASIKLQGMKESKLFMSDQFEFSEEAGGQYNFMPFYTEKVQLIKPNSSFDLTRLATALFWDIYPEGPEYPEYQNYPVFKLFMKWLTYDNGSFLFFKNNSKIDRFVGFSLYKAIAKFAKNAVPQKEISELSCFLDECPLDETPLIIEE